MAEQQKKAAKGQKIGRHSRAPNSAMQTRRTERNKRINIERNPGSDQGVISYGRKHVRTLNEPTRPSRLPALDALRVARLARLAAQADIRSYEDGWTSNVTFAEKILKAVRPQVSLHDWKLAMAFQKKQAAAKAKRVVV